MCLNRLGSLEIPGAVPGPPGQNGNDGGIGPQGSAGIGWITGQGIPPNNLTTYPNGTLYLDTLLGNIFQYDSSTLTWPLVGSIAGPQGQPGAQGPVGPSGNFSLIAASGITAPLTTRNVWASLYSATVSGSQLCPATSDVAKVCVKFTGYQTNSTVGLGISSALKLRFNVNGVPISNSGTNYSELFANVDVNGVYKTYIDAELLIVRTSSLAAKYIAKCLNGDSLNSRVFSFENDDPGVTINFSTNVTISVEAQMFTASVGTVFAQGSSFYIETLRQ